MAYNISLSNGDLLAVIDDGTADVTSASVALVGKNFSGYGQYLNENFVHLTENFAGETAPPNQLVGQLWFDTNDSELKVWNSETWIPASKPTVVDDNITNAPHFPVISDSIAGSPQFKTSSNKGMVYYPSTGNFGLGAMLPEARLTVSNNDAANLADPNSITTIQAHGRIGQSSEILIDAYGGSISGGNYNVANTSSITLRRANGTTQAPESVKTNDLIGSVQAQAHNGTSYATTRGRISFVATENWSLGSNGTKINFFVTPNGGITPVLAATIDNNNTLQCLGNITTSANLTVSGTAHISGSVFANGDVTAYYTSDERLKTKFEKIKSALEKVMQLEGFTFNWNELAEDKDLNQRESGVSAQRVLSVLPEAVIKRDNGYLAVRYEKLVPLLVEAIKDLKEEVDRLKSV
jgi:hypothetical protein